MNNPSKAAMETAHLLQRKTNCLCEMCDSAGCKVSIALRGGHILEIALIIDRAIQEATKPLVEALEKISKMGIPTAIDINNQMDCARVYGEEKAVRIAKEALHAIKGD